jgi:solute carrier family 25 carnitine/acylcarnitine transporter 20/29
MTHNEKRSNAWREAQLGLFTGSIYGATHTITGHPLDTIKSKMQIQAGYAHLSAAEVARKMYKSDGFIEFYRGCVPPLWGSMMYRGIMISSYEYAFTWLEKHTAHDSIVQQDLVLGIRPMVPLASIFSAVVRGFFENPIEYAKVMGQTGQSWQWRDIYRGFSFQIIRTTALLIPIFTSLDVARRKTDLLKTLPGNFAVTALASAGAFIICWPLETLKNLAQSGTPHPRATFGEKLHYLGGSRGLYRGMGPGTLAGALRNGCAMMAMVYAQEWASKLGLR